MVREAEGGVGQKSGLFRRSKINGNTVTVNGIGGGKVWLKNHMKFDANSKLGNRHGHGGCNR